MECILSRGGAIAFTRVRITGQRREADCESPELIAYLHKCLSAPRTTPTGGIVYRAEFIDERGGSIPAELVVTTGDDVVAIGDPAEGDRLWGVGLPAPKPALVEELLRFLREAGPAGWKRF